jgi:hypothetical protein
LITLNTAGVGEFWGFEFKVGVEEHPVVVETTEKEAFCRFALNFN